MRIADREFGLIVGEPAEFRFLSSIERKDDPPAIPDRGARRSTLRRLTPMEVALPSEATAAEVVPVSLETAITETGMLQLWCVARDGRRWKLEFNVREQPPAMKVGIDLGTTNSALACVDPDEAEDSDFPPIHLLDIPQHIDDQRIEPRRLLPSFLYLGDQRYAGIYAREQGGAGPDPRGPLREVVAVEPGCGSHREDSSVGCAATPSGALTPVEASMRVSRASPPGLGRIAAASRSPNSNGAHSARVVRRRSSRAHRCCRRTSRTRKLHAARRAGRRLLFLDRVASGRNRASCSSTIRLVLVCDVGGGTTDFTLIRVGRDGDNLEFTRTAVGKHLLLGGDNLDLTLAWLVETKLAKPLSLRQRSGAATPVCRR